MKTGMSAAVFFAATIVAASAALAAPKYVPAPAEQNDAAIAAASTIGLRGSHDALDDGSQHSRVATGGPRRLSALAGSDDQAWASARSIAAVPWRHARKLPQH